MFYRLSTNSTNHSSVYLFEIHSLMNRFSLQEGKKLDFVVRVQSAKGVPKRFTVSKRVTL